MGALHIGMTSCILEPAGRVDEHLHSYEETFFVLEGHVDVAIDGTTHRLTAGDYGMAPVGLPHGWRNRGAERACWVEMAAPRPRSEEVDTLFTGGRDVSELLPVPTASEAAASETAQKARGPAWIGHFDGIPTGGLSAAGLGADIEGIRIEMLVDREFGASQSTLFVVEYDPGVELPLHDHPFEEGYLILRGAVETELDGLEYVLGSGDVLWAGVGCIHGFANRAAEPVRWLEVQAPQPPTRHATRFRHAWESLTETLKRPAATPG